MSKNTDSPGDPAALNTAYAYNTRPGARSAETVTSGWDPTIDRLLAQDYQFLGCTYAGGGCLFRGVSAGLDAALVDRRLGRYEDERPLCRLEAELGVYLISHDLSDALSVARLWDSGDSDAAVFVLSAQSFADAWEARRAAVLGFAEPGVVFKYPFLVEPPVLEQVELVLVSPALRSRYEALLAETRSPAGQQSLRAALQWCRTSGLWDRIVAPAGDDRGASRQSIEAAADRMLEARRLTSARPRETTVYPKRGCA